MNTFNALKIAKFAASTVVGLGTGKIVGKVIKQHVTPENIIDKVTVTAAAWVIGAMATQATKNATDKMIDDAAETVQKVVKMGEDSRKLAKINRKESTFEAEGLDQSRYREENGRWVRISDEDWLSNNGVTPDPSIV